jgi:tetratricopeptide (TPR) repeat protein
MTPRRLRLMLFFALLSLLIGVVVHVVSDRRRPPAVAPPPAPIEPSSPDSVTRIQQRLRANPADTQAYAELGLALLQQVRETGDVTLYGRAGEAFDAALQRDPNHLDALVGQGVLALALHHFEGALELADKAWAINPYRAHILGIKVDGLVELGHYQEAVDTLQAMIDLRPDLHAYSRISYLRELYGETEGAIAAMREAASMGVPGTEEWLWTTVQVGHLYWNSGKLREAEQMYRQALAFRANYPYAIAGLARVKTAKGNESEAIADYEALVKRLPLPEFVVALGEIYEASGQMNQARQQYELVRVMQKLNVSSGMNMDLELATFEVNHGNDPIEALKQARVAYADRPIIYAADTLAWALYKTGDYQTAQQFSQEALRLGTQDALLSFHAGMIADALGKRDEAKSALSKALMINSQFSVLYAPQAQAKLAELEP